MTKSNINQKTGIFPLINMHCNKSGNKIYDNITSIILIVNQPFETDPTHLKKKKLQKRGYHNCKQI